jgi:molybdenum cofactor cytidylyltransferase
MSIAGVVLAAGASSRMGRSKPLLTVEGQTFLARIIRSMESAGISSTLVVVAPQASLVAEEAQSHGARVTVNPCPERGQMSSLQVAVSALGDTTSGAVVALVDHPLVASATYRTVAEAVEKDEDRFVIPTFEGRRGHPLGLGRRWFGELWAVPEGEGVRWLLHRNPAAVLELAVDDPWILLDVDTPEDEERLQRGLQQWRQG